MTEKEGGKVKRKLAVYDDEKNEPADDISFDGFSSTDEDENGDGDLTQGQDVIRVVPKIPCTKAARTSISIAKSQGKHTESSSTIYIGRIPHGFYLNQMRNYFSQFGLIKNIRLAVNRMTARSKHYGFIEFETPEIAEIVSKTMNNYLLFGHLLKVHVMHPDKVHPKIWKGATQTIRKLPVGKRIQKSINSPAVKEQWEKRVKREQKRRNYKIKTIQKKMKDYEFESTQVESLDKVKPLIRFSKLPANKKKKKKLNPARHIGHPIKTNQS